MTSTNWNFQSDINKGKSHISLDRVTSTKWHPQYTSTEWHQQNDINRMTSTEWHPKMYCLTLTPCSLRYDFIPFTCRQWVPTSMIKTGRTTMTAALSKTECSILHAPTWNASTWWSRWGQLIWIINLDSHWLLLPGAASWPLHKNHSGYRENF